MRFALLGSGSQGNGLLVQHGATCLLLDCGFGVNEAVRRLARLGVTTPGTDRHRGDPTNTTITSAA